MLPASVHSRQYLAILHLLGSGAVAAIGLTLIASGRLHIMAAELTVFLLLFVHWQVLGVVICKVGLDQLVFAVSRDPTVHLELAKVMMCRVAPLAIVFSCACLWVFPPLVCVAICASVVCDVLSTLLLAELNGRGQHGSAAFAGLLNYPVFFVLLALVPLVMSPNVLAVAATFGLSSLGRASWLGCLRRKPEGAVDARPTGSVGLVTQPVLNHILFRADQLALAIPALRGAIGVSDLAELRAYLFLAKLPELVAGLVTVVGAVAFPRWALQPPEESDVGRQLRRGPRGQLLAMSVPILGLCTALYMMFWAGAGRLTFWNGVPFFTNALLILPVNLLTYSMIARGRIHGLLRCLVPSVIPCAMTVVLVCLTKVEFPIWGWACVVPIQLGIFVTLSANLGWGAAIGLFEPQGSVAGGSSKPVR